MKILKRWADWWYLLAGFLFIVCLVRWWLPGNTLVAGHDAGLALNIHNFFINRLVAWNPNSNFGQDSSVLFGSLTLHALDWLFALVSGTQYAGNKSLIVFWLFTLFVSGFWFAKQLQKYLGWAFAYFFPILITFNFFIFQSIFIVERAKYGVVAASLLFLGILLKVQERKISIYKGSFISALLYSIFNGGSWYGIPLFGGIIVMITVYLCLLLLDFLRQKDMRELLRVMQYLGLTIVFFTLLNSYSLFPYVATFVSKDLALIQNSEIVGSNQMWLDNISMQASPLNLLRMQGVPDWYAAEGINQGHPYAKNYLTDPWLITLSFAIPLLALLSLLLMKTDKQKRWVYYGWVLTLISIFFVAGSHAPLGGLYLYLYSHVPGFAIFRSPFYKFGYALYFALALLLAFSISALIERAPKRYHLILLSLSILLWLGFSSAMLKPAIFEWKSGTSTQVNVPSYVWEFDQWAQASLPKDSRTVMLPPLDNYFRNDSYSWGYWSLAQLPSLFLNRPVVSNNSDLNDQESHWMNDFYQSIKDRDENRFLDLAERLNIHYFLMRRDVQEEKDSHMLMTAEESRNNLLTFSSVSMMKTFGKWEVYRLSSTPSSQFMPIVQTGIVNQNVDQLGHETIANRYSLYGITDNQRSLALPLINQAMTSFKCVSCEIEQPGAQLSLPSTKLFPNSIFYFIRENQEKKVLDATTEPSKKVDAYLGYSLRHLSQITQMIDLGIADRFVISDLEQMNEFLTQIKVTIPQFSNPQYDFARFRLYSNSLGTIEDVLRNYIKRSGVASRSDQVREQILAALWNINEIENYYQPISREADQWNQRKLYLVEFLGRENSVFMLKNSTLPHDVMGKVVYPSTITGTVDHTAINFKYESSASGWTVLKPDTLATGSGNLTLQFPSLPNLFVTTQQRKMPIASGQVGCLMGTIAQFQPSKNYLLSLTAPNKDQTLHVAINDHLSNDNLSPFVHGRDEYNINPLVPNKAFKHYFQAYDSSKNPDIYICTDNDEFPNVSFSVTMVIEPELALVTTTQSSVTEVPTIYQQEIDPTNYRLSFQNVQPFILQFNQHYSSLWKIYPAYTTDDWLESIVHAFEIVFGLRKPVVTEDQHITINGYANGWIIATPGKYDWELVYYPQQLFIVGLLCSLMSLLSIVIVGRIKRWF